MQDNLATPTSSTQENLTSLTDSALPNVEVFGTGGTISGGSNSATDVTDYQSGEFSVQSLLENVPEIAQVANISATQVTNTSSSDITSDILLSMSKRANALLHGNVSGIVITHGTNTMEETAFFLELTAQTAKPIVLVGAMRPATAISADGPMNLLNAINLAASPDAVSRGVMIALNDYIGSAFYISKTHSTSLDTFKAPDQGYLGQFVGGKAKFYYEPSRVNGLANFDVTAMDQLPEVNILYCYQDISEKHLNAMIEAGSDGLVIATSGNGSVPTHVKSKLQELKTQGYPIVLSTRTGNGYVTHKDFAIASGFLNPQKARILLMLALTKTKQIDEIERLFGTQEV
ncbi:asparaginase [Vibrio sp. S4M6]|uniref:asparaginase n=1 Tax=Vibrio sinus TaxID=2946865 RepID=UPI002029D2DA|nr:asparaginase [Vibrio sinus]MCL9782685.1 asparaginase [Vibrio sinus]